LQEVNEIFRDTLRFGAIDYNQRVVKVLPPCFVAPKWIWGFGM